MLSLQVSFLLCRHLQHRLTPQIPSKQQAPVSPQSSQRGVRLSDGAVHPATSLNGPQSTEARQVAQQAAASIPSDAAQPDSKQGIPCTAGQGADEASNPSQSREEQRSGVGAAELCSAAQHAGHVRYFQRKQAPWLTGWWECTCAFMAVFLLPLISIVPFSTTAERPDSHFGQP